MQAETKILMLSLSHNFSQLTPTFNKLKKRKGCKKADTEGRVKAFTLDK